MAMATNIQILFSFACLFLFLYRWTKNKKNNSVLVNWPVLGMLPAILSNVTQIHEFATKILKESGGTLEFKGPWLCNMDFLVTSDPMNIHHIFSKNFSNYPKGPEFGTVFEPLGDGILAADSDSWALQRKIVHSFFKAGKFQLFLERTIQEKVARGLYPVLDHACAREIEVNLEDVIQRSGFDTICSLILGYDPECLSIGFSKVTAEKAIIEMEEAVLYRNVVPEKVWKLMKWLQIGQEKKLSRAFKTYDRFVYQCIESKQEKLAGNDPVEETGFDFLTAYFTDELEGALVKEGDGANKFLRDAVTSLVIAGRDTSSAALSWFFWLLATHPIVETKILKEIKDNLQLHKNPENTTYSSAEYLEDGCRSLQDLLSGTIGGTSGTGNCSHGIFSAGELNKLVYLHAALCETLRLYPSLPINHKASMHPDTLPSGHRVGANTKIYVSYYAMGRMEDIWGKDCLEFKPERWISDNGGIVHEPSYKFSVFGAGPRTCLGKDNSFVQMKIIAVAILVKYKIDIVKDHPVRPCNSVLLHMKHGLKVRVRERRFT